MNNGRKLENKIIRSYLFSNLKLYAIAMAALWITLWVLRILMPSVYTVSAFFVPIIGILIGLSVSGGLEQSQLMGFHCSRAMYSRLLMIRPILFSVLLTTFLLLTVWMGESVGQSVPMLQFIDMEEYQYLSKLELGAMNFSLLVFINSCICLDISLSQPLLSTFFSSALGQKSSKKNGVKSFFAYMLFVVILAIFSSAIGEVEMVQIRYGSYLACLLLSGVVMFFMRRNLMKKEFGVCLES